MPSNGEARQGSGWTDAEMTLLYNLKTQGLTYEQIAEQMNESSFAKREYNRNLCYKKWQQTDWTDWLVRVSGSSDSNDEQTDESETEKEKVIAKTIANHQRLITTKRSRTEVLIDSLKAAIYRLQPPTVNQLSPTPRQPGRSFTSEHVAVLLSDFHIGQSYTMNDTGGISSFDLDIFKDRMAHAKNAVLDITERHKHVYDLPHLHVICLGDIVAGMPDVGQWSPNYINMDIWDQMAEGVAALRDTVACWSQLFEKVSFYGIYGNHGRAARRGVQKEYTNWDRVAYEMIRLWLRDYTNIEWHIPDAWWYQTDILGWNFYMAHGDGIKSHSGTPWYGIERAAANICGLLQQRPDYMLFGHFHTPGEVQTSNSRVILNGSFLGGDMFSIKDLNRSDRPEQKMFGIHENKGITWLYNLYLNS